MRSKSFLGNSCYVSGERERPGVTLQLSICAGYMRARFVVRSDQEKNSKMKRSIIAITSLLTMALFVSAQSIKPETKVIKNKSRSNKSVKNEILKMEGQFKRAVSRHDAIKLNSLLAEVYVISFLEGETAIPRKRALEGYVQGKFSYHHINNAKVSIYGDTVQIVGEVARRPDSPERGQGGSKAISDRRDEENKSRITRWWAKREGRWQLTAEQLPQFEKERKPY